MQFRVIFRVSGNRIQASLRVLGGACAEKKVPILWVPNWDSQCWPGPAETRFEQPILFVLPFSVNK